MKNYVITGSLGHISRPLVEGLVQAGHSVRVITSQEQRAAGIEELGAKALVGSVQDLSFLVHAFEGADSVYAMVPPIWQTTDWRASIREVAQLYAEALRATKVQHVVALSSMGAHIGHGVGPVDGLYDLEQLLKNVPGLHVKFLRPSYFYYNFLSQIPLAKLAGIMGANYGTGEKLLLVDTRDIAQAALEELLSLSFTGHSVRYLYGDERSGTEIAEVLGKAIGQELKWVEFSDEEQKQGLLQAGLSATHAHHFTEMGKALRTGAMQEDARAQLPSPSPTKLEDFAHAFAEAYKR